MKETGKERAHERVFVIKDIFLDGTMSCTSADMCESGLFVNTTQYFKAEDIVKVTIPLESEKITLKAEVKYCQRGIGIGIMFIDMDSKQKEKIKGFLDSLK